ncbi:hypothetical protein OIDMADRAFT_181148 [Oidiodendron maius Zn]|uniref:Methyltransferase type 12 domain-containing protein n=1 Tax=Oidiodendron maius (strain Zn) TaxID=913774 RepID=A0A0C3CLA0_OIDMZ|nr:hypothetical protein OIDMADRAFT_181148 [Oidiodendron maius Zn]
MAENRDYEAINRANWDERAPVHAEAEEYNIPDFIKNKDYLGDVITFDVPRIGDITGKTCVHLQCHIGTDTLGLARLGATSVTGLDFSPKSLTEANKLAAATIGSGGEKIKFVESSVYDALNVLPEGHFDLVFTGVGAICWIHSIQNWAEVVSKLLKKGGRLFIREGHPMLWTLDDKRSDLLQVKYPYFEREKPTIFEDAGTYVGGGQHKFENTQSVEFNHGIGEIIQALLDHGMRITAMEEHQSVPWEALPGQMTEVMKNEWTLTDQPWRLPHSYTLQAVKE